MQPRISGRCCLCWRGFQVRKGPHVGRGLQEFDFPSLSYPHSKDLVRSQGAAIRTLPVHAAASQPPQIIFHAVVANLKTAGTGPAKGLGVPAATALVRPFFLSPSFSLRSHHGFMYPTSGISTSSTRTPLPKPTLSSGPDYPESSCILLFSNTHTSIGIL